MKVIAFTLAEVMITLAIIGIIAAMTLPPLIQKHNNRVVETRLMKFYSEINQAILMAEIDYGDKKDWYEDLSGQTTDSDGKTIYDTTEVEAWIKKYLMPYMKIVKTESYYGYFIMYFSDGSGFTASRLNTRDWFFYPGHTKKCMKSCNGKYDCMGICQFAFNFKPNSNTTAWKYHYNKGFEPFKYAWNGEISKLYNNTPYGCQKTEKGNTSINKLYCTAIIQQNGWKIPEDYPYKVKY